MEDLNNKPTPLGNIYTLESQLNNITSKKKELEKQLSEYENDELNMDTVEKMEKLEEELEFLTKYYRTLEDQLVVIMNENNVVIPPKQLTNNK